MISDKSEFEFTSAELIELENIKLSSFTIDNVWELGLIVRELAGAFEKSIVIDISTPSGQALFHSVTKAGASLDNDDWVNRKKASVARFGKSSFLLGNDLRASGRTFEQVFSASESVYCTHGGAVPIYVNGVDTLVGILTISGLKQHQDHLLGIEALQILQKKLSK